MEIDGECGSNPKPLGDFDSKTKISKRTGFGLRKAASTAPGAFLNSAKYLDACYKWAPVLLLIGGYFGIPYLSKSDPQPSKQEAIIAAQAPDLVCIDANSISDAYETVGPRPIGAQREKFKTQIKGRKICGKGWAAFFKQTAAISGQRIVIVSDGKGRKLQLGTNDGAWEFKENDPIWVAEAIFDELSEDDVLVGHAAKIARREIQSKPLAKAPKLGDQDDSEHVKNDGKNDQPILGIFRFDWLKSKTPSAPKPTEELRDKYTRD